MPKTETNNHPGRARLKAHYLALAVFNLGLAPIGSVNGQETELPCIAVTDAVLPDGVAPFGGTCRIATAEASLRSISGTDSAFITFANLRDAPVHVYWLNYSGHRVFYARLEPGQSFTQQTYLTHPWIVTTPTGDPLVAFMPSPVARRALIR